MASKDDTESLNYDEFWQILPLLLEKESIECYHDDFFIEEKHENSYHHQENSHVICKWYENMECGAEKETIYKALCLGYKIEEHIEDKNISTKQAIFNFFTDSILAPERLDRCHLNLLEAKRRARKRENVIDDIQTTEDGNIGIINDKIMIKKSKLKEGITKVRNLIDEAVKFYKKEDFTSRLNVFKQKIYHTKYDNTLQGFVNRYLKPVEALSKLPKAIEKPFCQPMVLGVTELKILSMTRMLPEKTLQEGHEENFKHLLKNFHNSEGWRGKKNLLGMLRLRLMMEKLKMFETLGDNANLITTSNARFLEDYLSEKVKKLSINNNSSSWKQTLQNLSTSENYSLFKTNEIITRTSPTYQLVPFSSKTKQRTNLIVHNIVLTKNNQFIQTLPTNIETIFLEQVLQTDADISEETNIKMLVSFLAILMQRKKELVLPKTVEKIVNLRSEILRYKKKKFWLTIHMPGYCMGYNMMVFLINCLYLILFMQNFNWCIDFHLNGEMLHCVSESLLEPEEIANIQGTLILVPGDKRIDSSNHFSEILEQFVNKLMDYELDRKIKLY